MGRRKESEGELVSSGVSCQPLPSLVCSQVFIAALTRFGSGIGASRVRWAQALTDPGTPELSLAVIRRQ